MIKLEIQTKEANEVDDRLHDLNHPLNGVEAQHDARNCLLLFYPLGWIGGLSAKPPQVFFVVVQARNA